jgi:hypothetical protein
MAALITFKTVDFGTSPWCGLLSIPFRKHASMLSAFQILARENATAVAYPSFTQLYSDLVIWHSSSTH